MTALRLGVNVDHVATVRNARGGAVPDPVRAALLAIEAGADGITAHLREDRRHILDDDMRPPQSVDHEAAQFRDGRDRSHARHCAEHPSARLLPRAGKADRAHHRRRARRGQRVQGLEAVRRRAHAGRNPGVDVHRTLAGGVESQRRTRSASRRAPHRGVVRRAGAGRGRQSRSRVRSPPHRGRSNRGAGARVSCRPRPRLRHRPAHRRPAADRRTQHRPFPHWRGDLRRARRNREGDAHGDERGRAPRWSARL